MGLVNGWGSETLYDKKGNLLGTYVGNFENGEIGVIDITSRLF